MYLRLKSKGMTMISLYIRVPQQSKKNPTISNGKKSSQPTLTEKIQISSVLEVSIVDLCAHDAYFVILTPQALNVPIEIMMITE